MFRRLRQLTGAFLGLLERAVGALEEIAEIAVQAGPPGDLGPIEARLGELERTRALWEADVEAMVQRAEGEKRSARAAEERARYLKKKAGADEDDDEGMEEARAAYAELLRGANGTSVPEKQLQPVHPGVGLSRQDQRELGRRYKFGG